MRYIIYDSASGEIKRVVVCDHFLAAVNDGESAIDIPCDFESNEMGWYVVINDRVIKKDNYSSLQFNESIVAIRRSRDAKLYSCDWTQTLDAPLTSEKKAEWASYRQNLRDFPDTCDPVNPAWPVAPN